MASLMENLIELLEAECSTYEKLLDLSMQKTPVIIEGKVEVLTKITDDESELVSVINRIDKQREVVMKDIATVLNKDVATLKLGQIEMMLSERPEEQRRLSEVHGKLKLVISQMQRVNEHNRVLIEKSLELVEYNMNVVKSMRTAPTTANYTKGAYSAGNTMGSAQNGFDTKQ